MESIHINIQRHANSCHHLVKNTMHAWRDKPLADKNKEDIKPQSTHRYTISRNVMRSIVV